MQIAAHATWHHLTEEVDAIKLLDQPPAHKGAAIDLERSGAARHPARLSSARTVLPAKMPPKMQFPNLVNSWV